MMNGEILLDEKVDVVAVFRVGHQPCQPVRFRRQNGQEIGVTRVGLGFPVERGSKTIHIFDVTDEQADYRLEFDSVTLVWRLVREADHAE